MPDARGTARKRNAPSNPTWKTGCRTTGIRRFDFTVWTKGCQLISMGKPSLWRQIWPEFAAVAGLCVVLAVLASCQLVPKHPDPLSAIYPPGLKPPSTGVQAFSNAPQRFLSARMALPAPNVVLTCDIDLSGPFDGVHVYSGPQPGSLSLLAIFDHTNVFPVSLPMDAPSLVEVRSFINWPAPGIVQTWTNDDGSTGSQTITFREGPINGTPTFADFLFVPTNCQSIALMAFTNGLQLVGWGAAGAVYQIQSSTDLVMWQSNATVTGTNGPWQVRVDGSQAHTWFRTSMQ